ncbi:hypothetical protein NN561_007355 [Cricetulus griseus]
MGCPGSFPRSRSNPAALPGRWCHLSYRIRKREEQKQSFPHRDSVGTRRALRSSLPGPSPPARIPGPAGPHLVGTAAVLAVARPHTPCATALYPVPGVWWRPRGGERTGRRRRRGRSRGQLRPDSVTGVIPPPRPQEARPSATPALRVTLPSRGRSIVPGFALRWGLGHA